MLGMAHSARVALLVAQAGVGEEAREVVEAVARNPIIPIQKTVLEEVSEFVLRGVLLKLPDCRGGARVEGRGEDGECAPELLQVFAEQVVAEAERGLDFAEGFETPGRVREA